jgi:hypothetical protein
MKVDNIVPKPTSSLYFDRKNPRLAGLVLDKKMSEDDVALCLWETMDAKELAMSISASGFFQHEPLIVAEESGKLIVIEGNRRLAAVKALLDKALAAKVGFINEASAAVIDSLKELPVVITTRNEAWRYLGFKHVNGPARWGSYEKAHYIASVHRTEKVSLLDIAKQIGDTHKTVQRLFRGLMVLEQAERNHLFLRDNRYNAQFAFSHLYTGLNYDGFIEFLSLTPEAEETENPVPDNKLEELKQIMLWLYGTKDPKVPPVIRSQNPDLRRLNAIITKPIALTSLKRNGSLDDAFELTQPASHRFLEALVEAQQQMERARSLITEGYDYSEPPITTAELVKMLAEDLAEEMRRKQVKMRKSQENSRE